MGFQLQRFYLKPPSRSPASGLNRLDLENKSFKIAVIGTDKNIPGTPQIKPQNNKDRRITAG